MVETMEHWVWKCCLNQELKRAPMNKDEGQDCGASMEYILQNLDYLEQDLVRSTSTEERWHLASYRGLEGGSQGGV